MFARGVDRRRIFNDADDYDLYTQLLGGVVRRQGWRLLCYCLMPNHVHLLLETPECNLANGMQLLQSRYALAFNRRNERIGHLFETAYRSPLVTSDAALTRTLGYIVMNPVAARLCRLAHEWPWGSHAAVFRGHAPRWLDHDRATERLDVAYADLIATREQEAGSKRISELPR